MKTPTAILSILTFLLLSVPSFALAPASNTSHAPASNPSVTSKMTVNDFLALTPKKIKEMTGQKMSLTQKLAFKYTQHKLKREVRRNPEMGAMPASGLINDSDFNLGGLVLGLFLPFVGVLIAYLIGDSDVIKWAWIGTAAFLLLFLIFIVIL